MEASISGLPTGLVGTLGWRVRSGGVTGARATTDVVESPAGSGCYFIDVGAEVPPFHVIVDYGTGVHVSIDTYAHESLNELMADHLGVGSVGEKINAAASAGDPWTTALPGAYGAGSAGKIVGDNLNAKVGDVLTESQSHPTLAEIEATSVLAKQAKLDTLHDTRIPGVIQAQTGDSFARLGAPAGASVSADIAAVKADSAAIKTKTDNLPTDPADESLVIAATDAIMTRLGAPAGLSVSADVAAVKVDTAAVKAKTDNLPATPAAVGSAMTLTTGERDSIATALLDLADAVETGLTTRQALRLALAALAGKASGLATSTAVYRNAVADSKSRITATVDANGNRTVVTTDLT